MTDQIIQRASLLIQHRRYEEAMRELQNILSSEPNHPYALALMGVSSTELGKHDDALNYIQQALGQTPDNPYFLYLMGLVYTRKNKLKEATKFVQSAITFDPHNADYFGLLAMIKLDEKEWENALTYADRGLQINPENLTCLNSRSTALMKLNRKAESLETIKEALHNDPDNSHTHANLGWGLLEKGDHKRALESFRESLKLDPENAYAKAGLVEALKARYWFYRIFLKYVFWMSKKQSKYQVGIIFGLWIGVRILNYVSEANPAVAPFVKPLIYLYAAFAISTWILDPLFNLLLRWNPYGRYALTQDDLHATTFTGIGFGISVLGLIGVALTGGNDLPLLFAFYGAGFMILCGSMFKPQDKMKRALAMTIALGLCASGLFYFIQPFLGIPGNTSFMIFLWGTLAYQFLIPALSR